MAKHINITDDIKNKIIDFTHGDDKYWKNNFKDVMNELKDVKKCLYCKRWHRGLAWRCHEELCEFCDDEWGFGQYFWERYGEDRDDGIVAKYVKIQKVLDDNREWNQIWDFYDEMYGIEN